MQQSFYLTEHLRTDWFDRVALFLCDCKLVLISKGVIDRRNFLYGKYQHPHLNSYITESLAFNGDDFSSYVQLITSSTSDEISSTETIIPVIPYLNYFFISE